MPSSTEQKNLDSHGQIGGQAPVFGLDSQEIMSVKDNLDGTVTIYTEDPDEPGRLNPTTMYRKDYLNLVLNQK